MLHLTPLLATSFCPPCPSTWQPVQLRRSPSLPHTAGGLVVWQRRNSKSTPLCSKNISCGATSPLGSYAASGSLLDEGLTYLSTAPRRHCSLPCQQHRLSSSPSSSSPPGRLAATAGHGGSSSGGSSAAWQVEGAAPQVQVDATGAGSASADFAMMSRIFVAVQPAVRQGARQLFRLGRPLLSGPLTVLLLLFTLVGILYSLVRQRIAAAVRACPNCRGYGIQRCSLCGGRGEVGWEGKWAHDEPCPMCLGHRFVNCGHCGGHFRRALFMHRRSKPKSVSEKYADDSIFARLDRLGD